MPLPGSSTPTAFEDADQQPVSRKPATTPSAEPISPMHEALERSERLICFGVAPIAASTASSRSRWATMTLNVL